MASERAITSLCTKLGLPIPKLIGNGVYVCIATMNPSIATAIMKDYHITTNRNPKPGKIKQLGHDMVSKMFLLTHQGLCFNSDLKLCDGQNRLRACIEWKESFQTMITFNIPVDSMVVIDNQRSRTPNDAAKISERWCACLDNSEWSALTTSCFGIGAPQISTQRRLAAADCLKAPLMFVSEQFPSKLRKITSGPVLAAIIRAYFHVDRARLNDFCTILREGIVSKKSDQAAQLLFRYLHQRQTSGGSAGDRRVTFKKSMYAIDAFCSGRQITTLRCLSADIFPLPKRIKNALADVYAANSIDDLLAKQSANGKHESNGDLNGHSNGHAKELSLV